MSPDEPGDEEVHAPGLPVGHVRRHVPRPVTDEPGEGVGVGEVGAVGRPVDLDQFGAGDVADQPLHRARVVGERRRCPARRRPARRGGRRRTARPSMRMAASSPARAGPSARRASLVASGSRSQAVSPTMRRKKRSATSRRVVVGPAVAAPAPPVPRPGGPRRRARAAAARRRPRPRIGPGPPGRSAAPRAMVPP